MNWVSFYSFLPYIREHIFFGKDIKNVMNENQIILLLIRVQIRSNLKVHKRKSDDTKGQGASVIMFPFMEWYLNEINLFTKLTYTTIFL